MPYSLEIGLGQADMIEEIEIRWHGSGKVQVFTNINQPVSEGADGKNAIEPIQLKTLDWILPDRLCDLLLLEGVSSTSTGAN